MGGKAEIEVENSAGFFINQFAWKFLAKEELAIARWFVRGGEELMQKVDKITQYAD